MAAPEALTRKVGPFPVYQWGIIIVAGVGIAIVVRRATGDAGAAPGSAGGSSLSAAGPGAVGAFGSSGPTYLPDASVTAEPTQITTNSEWVAEAFRRIMADPNYSWSPFAVQQALERYTIGQATSADQGIISAALELAGVPPDGAPVSADPYIVGAPDPGAALPPISPSDPAANVPVPVPGGAQLPAVTVTAPKPAAAPSPSTQTITIKTEKWPDPLGSLSGIGQIYYGSASRAVYTEIARVNGIADPNRIGVGQSISLPPIVAGLQRKRNT